VQVLIDFLSRTPAVELKDLAFSLNTSLVPGGSRLAVVADSTADLQSRLRRAAERLADSRCQYIKDSRGSYFFEEPLHPRGKLALLFPGEGSQYLNMLRDLIPHFPEIRAHFDRCDRLSVEFGRDRPISTAILIPDDATSEERERAEHELWRLNNAIASILITDWSIYQLLRTLGLRPDALASHSAGEFSALAAAGCLEHNDALLEKLFELGQLLRRQEDDGSMTAFVLLAAGANRRTVTETIAHSSAEIHIAMDNCPHQTVLAGPPLVMAAFETELKARGIVCERLPFSRPYHTPLFEPFLEPVAQLFQSVEVRPTHTPTYSCITGQLFPLDPESIRRLAVEHWARPVEFARMIETMYDDGVRLFVESGPRGNLTSFLQDILRGRSFEAVAANLAHRSGLTQLNHMAAILAAHHVPLRFEHFYSRRDPQPIAWEVSGHPFPSLLAREQAREKREFLPPPPSPFPQGGAGGSAAPRAAVMQGYWSAMEQFLDVQREVMEQFLTRRRGGPATSTAVWPLLGEIIHHEPGRELVMRRRMDLNEDCYAADHTLGARNASAVDPTQHGLPFMPMAFSLEMMAEAAALLVPGKLVLGFQCVRLQRWLPFDDDPTTIELTARVGPENPSEVGVEIRDLGNAVCPGNADTPVVTGTVLFGDCYPEPPPVEDFPLTDECPCRYTAHQLYEGEHRLFHGPLFHALVSTDRQGEEGIEGYLQTLSHSKLFRSSSQPDLLLDPLLIDASTHLLGCWHLGRTDQTGRVVLPYELGAVVLYGPRPITGTRMKCRVRIERHSARQVSHRIDLITPDGRLWCQLAPAEYWRFYWPLEYVEFFRHKEQFLLGKPWPLCGNAPEEICGIRLEPPDDLCQPVQRAALARITLTRSEWSCFRLLKASDRERTDWLFGRIAAKDAVRSLWLKRHGQRLYPADIELDTDGHGCVQARYRDSSLREELPRVCFASAPGVSIALSTFGGRPGIALCRLSTLSNASDAVSFDRAERELLDAFGPAREEGIARFRCARTAIANALEPSRADDPQSIMIRAVDVRTGRILVALGLHLLTEYPEYRLDLLAVNTAREGDLIVATTLCERAQ
jgi:malonyl CoA-acyl carrier protein transacylase